MSTPTQRTLNELRKRGYTVAVVEKWNPHAKIRQDLFGWIDILAIRENEILGVQATGATNHSARLKKLRYERGDEVQQWLAAGGVAQVWSWRSKPRILKNGTKGKSKHWVPKITDVLGA